MENFNNQFRNQCETLSNTMMKALPDENFHEYNPQEHFNNINKFYNQLKFIIDYIKVGKFKEDNNSEQGNTFLQCIMLYLKHIKKISKNMVDISSDKVLELINIVSDDSILTYKHNYMEEIMEPILKIVVDSCSSIISKGLLRVLIIICRSFDSKKKPLLANKHIGLFTTMTEQLLTCGDIELQRIYLEFIFRMTHKRRKTFGELFFPNDEDVKDEFININLDEFEYESRYLLLAVNKKYKTVVSIKCKAITVNSLEYMEDRNTYVDFNLKTKNLTFPFNFDDCSLPESLCPIFNISFYNISAAFMDCSLKCNKISLFTNDIDCNVQELKDVLELGRKETNVTFIFEENCSILRNILKDHNLNIIDDMVNSTSASEISMYIPSNPATISYCEEIANDAENKKSSTTGKRRSRMRNVDPLPVKVRRRSVSVSSAQSSISNVSFSPDIELENSSLSDEDVNMSKMPVIAEETNSFSNSLQQLPLKTIPDRPLSRSSASSTSVSAVSAAITTDDSDFDGKSEMGRLFGAVETDVADAVASVDLDTDIEEYMTDFSSESEPSVIKVNVINGSQSKIKRGKQTQQSVVRSNDEPLMQEQFTNDETCNEPIITAPVVDQVCTEDETCDEKFALPMDQAFTEDETCNEMANFVPATDEMQLSNDVAHKQTNDTVDVWESCSSLINATDAPTNAGRGTTSECSAAAPLRMHLSDEKLPVEMQRREQNCKDDQGALPESDDAAAAQTQTRFSRSGSPCSSLKNGLNVDARKQILPSTNKRNETSASGESSLPSSSNVSENRCLDTFDEEEFDYIADVLSPKDGGGNALWKNAPSFADTAAEEDFPSKASAASELHRIDDEAVPKVSQNVEELEARSKPTDAAVAQQETGFELFSSAADSVERDLQALAANDDDDANGTSAISKEKTETAKETSKRSFASSANSIIYQNGSDGKQRTPSVSPSSKRTKLQCLSQTESHSSVESLLGTQNGYVEANAKERTPKETMAVAPSDIKDDRGQTNNHNRLENASLTTVDCGDENNGEKHSTLSQVIDSVARNAETNCAVDSGIVSKTIESELEASPGNDNDGTSMFRRKGRSPKRILKRKVSAKAQNVGPRSKRNKLKCLSRYESDLSNETTDLRNKITTNTAADYKSCIELAKHKWQPVVVLEHFVPLTSPSNSNKEEESSTIAEKKNDDNENDSFNKRSENASSTASMCNSVEKLPEIIDLALDDSEDDGSEDFYQIDLTHDDDETSSNASMQRKSVVAESDRNETENNNSIQIQCGAAERNFLKTTDSDQQLSCGNDHQKSQKEETVSIHTKSDVEHADTVIVPIDLQKFSQKSQIDRCEDVVCEKNSSANNLNAVVADLRLQENENVELQLTQPCCSELGSENRDDGSIVCENVEQQRSTEQKSTAVAVAEDNKALPSSQTSIHIRPDSPFNSSVGSEARIQIPICDNPNIFDCHIVLHRCKSPKSVASSKSNASKRSRVKVSNNDADTVQTLADDADGETVDMSSLTEKETCSKGNGVDEKEQAFECDYEQDTQEIFRSSNENVETTLINNRTSIMDDKPTEVNASSAFNVELNESALNIKSPKQNVRKLFNPNDTLYINFLGGDLLSSSRVAEREDKEPQSKNDFDFTGVEHSTAVGVPKKRDDLKQASKYVCSALKRFETNIRPKKKTADYTFDQEGNNNNNTLVKIDTEKHGKRNDVSCAKSGLFKSLPACMKPAKQVENRRNTTIAEKPKRASKGSKVADKSGGKVKKRCSTKELKAKAEAAKEFFKNFFENMDSVVAKSTSAANAAQCVEKVENNNIDKTSVKEKPTREYNRSKTRSRKQDSMRAAEKRSKPRSSKRKLRSPSAVSDEDDDFFAKSPKSANREIANMLSTVDDDDNARVDAVFRNEPKQCLHDDSLPDLCVESEKTLKYMSDHSSGGLQFSRESKRIDIISDIPIVPPIPADELLLYGKPCSAVHNKLFIEGSDKCTLSEEQTLKVLECTVEIAKIVLPICSKDSTRYRRLRESLKNLL